MQEPMRGAQNVLGNMLFSATGPIVVVQERSTIKKKNLPNLPA